MRNTDIKHIYNTFLRISRQKQNKPFKLRSNWDDFEKSDFYLPVLKLKNFFDRNYTVNIEDYFLSPYEVYEEKTYYDLDFYNTLSAVKVYNIFCGKKNQLDADNEIQVNSILRGLKFIKKFCIEKNISLSDYLNYLEPGAVVNSFIIHLKEKNISVYNLFTFKDFDKIYSRNDFDTLRFILNDLPLKLSILRAKFYNSKKGKSIAINGLKIIEKEINQNLLDKSKK